MKPFILQAQFFVPYFVLQSHIVQLALVHIPYTYTITIKMTLLPL